jgi:oxygen-independent coproporphyrinogen-3 oxidase
VRVAGAAQAGDAFEARDLARRLEELLPRYLEDGPRYTSYPTVPAWTERFGAAELRAALARAGAAGEDVSLYVHVPFCRSLCHFCACNRTITRDAALPERYLDVVAREIAAVRDAVGAPLAAAQVHWGGGTPTHLEPAQIRRLHARLADAFPPRALAEQSIEVDPRVTTDEHVEALRACGFTRISLGVQDFDARVQAAIHRTQPVALTAALTERARRAGFESVSFDLIYGLPFQTEASFERTLAEVIALAPDRIAIYGYAHVTWVAKQQRGFERGDLPSPATRLRLQLLALTRLLAAGYEAIGLDHFALPHDDLARARRDGRLQRNFMGYTVRAGAALLGVGPSAISELPDAYAQDARELPAWEAAVGARGLATAKGHALTDDDRRRRFVIGRIMCQGGVDAAAYRACFGEALADRFAAELARLAPLERDGLVVRGEDGSLRVTPVGRFFLRNVAMPFDAYLPAQREAGRPVFSKTV